MAVRITLWAVMIATGLAWPVGCLARAAEAERGAKDILSLREIRNAGIVRQYWDLSCGAAALATLLTYQLDDPVSERQVALGMLSGTNPLRVRQRFGFSLLDLKRYAESRGFSALGYTRLTLGEVLALAPVIVPIRPNGFNHFVVLRESRGDRLVLGDPAFGNRSLTRDRFERIWADGIGFVVFEPGAAPPINALRAPAALGTAPSAMTIRAAEGNMRAHMSRP